MSMIDIFGEANMKIWRLIAHHEKATEAVELMTNSNRIAIGWSDIGDLSKAKPRGPSDITMLISEVRADHANANMGGPSLWNLYSDMQEGDFVILSANGRRRCVFEVAGPYVFEPGPGQILGYGHQRDAVRTDMDPDQLWESCGSAVAAGQNLRWTLSACSGSESARAAVLSEGSRFSVTSTAIERSTLARKKCIEKFGHTCFICKYDFVQTFGSLGEDFIHVHHRVDIATKPSVHLVNPTEDLVPLCPNCHAMAHRRIPAIPIEELQAIYAENRV